MSLSVSVEIPASEIYYDQGERKFLPSERLCYNRKNLLIDADQIIRNLGAIKQLNTQYDDFLPPTSIWISAFDELRVQLQQKNSWIPLTNKAGNINS